MERAHVPQIRSHGLRAMPSWARDGTLAERARLRRAPFFSSTMLPDGPDLVGAGLDEQPAHVR
eukprot:7257617-Pyramimonas_sp.AAC.1